MTFNSTKPPINTTFTNYFEDDKSSQNLSANKEQEISLKKLNTTD